MIAEDGVFTDALTSWLTTNQRWTSRDRLRTSGRTELDGAAVSLLRPKDANRREWNRISARASRVRILSSSTLESVLVAQGSTDAFLDAGTDTHRIMDLAAAAVIVPQAGGAVIHTQGRPIEFDIDLSKRWSGIVAATPELAEQLAEKLG